MESKICTKCKISKPLTDFKSKRGKDLKLCFYCRNQQQQNRINKKNIIKLSDVVEIDNNQQNNKNNNLLYRKLPHLVES